MTGFLPVLELATPAEVGILVVLVILGLMMLGVLSFVPLWVRVLAAGAPVRFLELVGMRLRRVPPGPIVRARIQAHHAGLEVTTAQLEQHYREGGDPQKVVSALLAAREAGAPMTWDQARAMDLAGEDVVAAARRGA